MSTGGRADGASSSHRSSPVPRGPPTPTSSSPFSDGQRGGQSILADRYTLLTELGRGANGRVFKAFDYEAVRYVAVKQISISGFSKEQLNGVVGEIDLLKNLDHPNIVQYYDSIKTNNHLYIILEYMESGSLAVVVKHMIATCVSERLVAISVTQVLKGLKYLHAQGVVHRDIKGANILTTKDMVIKLADFGVAKPADRGSRGTKEDYYNTIVGSPYWMAPEVIEMKSVTTAADIWSIGCLVVELITGAAPYFDCQIAPALYRIVQDKHPPLPHGISESLRSFLLSCFIKDPSKRPTAEALLAHDWIVGNQDRSISPNKIIPKALSQTSASTSGTSIVTRILQHKTVSKPSKPPDSTTEGVSLERAESPLASSQLSRSSSVTPNDMIQDVTSGDDETFDLRRRSSIDKTRRSAANSMSGRSSVERGHGRQEFGPESVRKRDWRDDAHSGDRETTATYMASSTSSPESRMHSPPTPGKAESILNVIFSERTYDFESGIHRSRQGEIGPAYDSMQGIGKSGVGYEYDRSIVKRLLRQLQPHLSLSAVYRSLRDLSNHIQSNIEARSQFIHSDGLITLMELLQHNDNMDVIELTLSVSNAVCENDALLLKDAASVGLASEIFKCAEAHYPLSIRLQAARFIRFMTFAGIRTRDSLIQCQGLSALTALLIEGRWDSTLLKEISLACMQQILDDHPSIEDKILRMLCVADLPNRAISCLASIHSNQGPSQRVASEDLESAGRLSRRSSGSSVCISESYAPPTPSEQSGADYTPGTSEGASMPESQQIVGDRPSETVSVSEKLTELLLKISMSENETMHGHLVQQGTLQNMLQLLRWRPRDMTYKVAICLKHLSLKPSLIEYLQEAGTVAHLIPLLGQRERSEWTPQVQQEALIIIHNICKCSPEWREKAVSHGIVPYLCILSRSATQTTLQEKEGDGDVQKCSVPLLCRLLTMSSAQTRQILWEHDVVNLFLELLGEERWHQPVMDALATWLEEDSHQVEEKLVSPVSVQNLIAILRGYRYRSSNEISAVLDPLLRMLAKSNRLSRMMGTNGLAQVIMDMIKEADAETCLKLLRALRRIYGMHPKPKEFITMYGVQQYLEHLANSESEVDSPVLVRKEASRLLNAFQLNQIW